MPVAPCRIALLLLGLAAAPAWAADEGRERLEALKKALRQDDPAARIAGVDEFGRHAPRLSGDAQRGAARALRQALGEEPEATVRAAQVRALAGLALKESWVAVLLAARDDAEADVRRAARLELLGGGADLLQVIEALLREDEDPTFRADLLLLLGDRRRDDALGLLAAGLRDPHPRVVSAAAEALEAVSGEAVGYDAEAWARVLDERARRAPPPSPLAPGATVPTGRAPGVEPPPHVTRALVPEFLGLKLTSKDLVFVIDVSGSVGAGGIDGARRALERAVERLGSDVRFTAILFADEMHVFRPALAAATPRAKEDLHLFLRGIASGRRTDLFTPLNAGLEMVRRRLEEKRAAGEPVREAVSLVVVSDGRDNAARTPPEVLSERIERLDLAHAVIHAVVLGGEDHPFMRALARRTGGHYILSAPR
jgi:HEAT repeat protein